MYAAQIAWLLSKTHISLEDSGNKEQIRLYAPFTKAIITPDFLPNDLGKKQIPYKSNHELAYLHPNYYKSKDDIYSYLDISKEQPYAILRFVSWLATHDSGQKGLTAKNKEELIEYLISKNIKVFISTERHQLPNKLRQFSIKIPPDRMHDALANATIYVGEGATMASEAGVLGTPSLYVSTIERCYNIDQEKYGLVFNFADFHGVLNKIDEILNLENRLNVFQKRKKKFLDDKIDLTSFLIWFIENWPTSFSTMKENPDYQYNFK